MASTDRITRYVIATGIVMSQKCPGTIAWQSLAPWVPAVPVMQSWVDVGRVGCLSLSAHASNNQPLGDTFKLLSSQCCTLPRISRVLVTFSVINV
jgi:hypothetical protein